jgi:putative nucleotidyltransferase with HDIG domain
MTESWKAAMSADESRKAMENDPDLLWEEPSSGAPSEVVSTGDEDSKVSIQEELRRVDKLYGEALGYAHEFINDIKNGKPFDFNDATPMVGEFIDSVFRNESAAAAISKLKAFDEYSYTHCINVSILAVILGKKLGYSRERLEMLGIAGLFHDVGKVVIPDHILNKPGKLSDQEMDIMRTHPLRGYQILRDQPGIPPEVLRGCLEHHEKFDGSGYPRGLKGDEISDFSRLLTVVDVYDALTSKRVYKDPMPPGKVLAMMYKWRVTDFHPNIVEEFIKSLGVYPVGSFVRLSSGDHGVVVDHNPLDPLRPCVRVAFDHAMHRISVTEISLVDEACELTITDVVNPDKYKIDVYELIQ